MARRLAAMTGLLVGLAPAMAHAETNIDQGKTAAQIWASACAACHKSARGLASGKSRSTLTEFLREHYTTSREQAAGLATYVAAGGSEGSAASAPQGRGPRLPAERSRASTEEAKPANEQAAPAKPEEEGPAAAKLERPTDQEVRPEGEPALLDEPQPAAPGPRPPVRAVGRHDLRLPRHLQPETASPAREPAPVPADSGAAETPSSEGRPTSSAAAPTVAEPGEATIVPRDNIPD